MGNAIYRIGMAALALACTAPALAAPGTQRLTLRMSGQERNDSRPPVATAVTISADGRRLAAAGDDHCLHVWNAETGKKLGSLHGHRDWVRAARFAADADRLATVGADRSVCLWTLGEKPARLASRRLGAGALQAVAWRPDGHGLATVGFKDQLRVYDDLASPDAEARALACACEDTRAVAFSPDGRWLAAAGRNGIVRMWDLVASGGPRGLASDGRRVRALAFSPDGETLAAGGAGPAIRLWRRDDQMRTPDELLVRPGKVHSLAFVNETLLIAGDTQNEIRIWDTDTRSPRLTLRGHTGTVAALAVSADGRRMVSGSFDTTVRVWDLDPADLPAAKLTKKPADATR